MRLVLPSFAVYGVSGHYCGHYLIGLLIVSALLGVIGFVGRRRGGAEVQLRVVAVGAVYAVWSLYVRHIWSETTGMWRWIIIPLSFAPLFSLIWAPKLRKEGNPEGNPEQ
jgi:hypothetical protein